MNRAWLSLSLLLALGCSDDSSGTGDITDPGDGAVSTPDGSDESDGSDAPIGEDAGEITEEPAADAGSDAAPGLIDQVTEYLTCKPEEIDPIVDCVLVTCPMKPDPIMLAGCLIEMCAPMVEAVNEKCRECVTAAVAQDVAGLLTNCLDGEKIGEDLGGGG